MPVAEMRLDKLIAGAGLCSRSDAKKLIRSGSVTVDGKAVTDPAAHCDPDAQICARGERVLWQPYLYLMLHKPAGYLSVTEDPRAPTVLDLLPPELRKRNLSPAGRLDKDSEGFLILTSDGEFCHRVISPRSGVEKVYFIRVLHPFPPEAEAIFAAGAVLENGEICLPARLEPSEDRLSARVTLSEGKYHQVKRMALAAGTRVCYLRRESIGGVALDPALVPGAYRELTPQELRRIDRQYDNLHK